MMRATLRGFLLLCTLCAGLGFSAFVLFTALGGLLHYGQEMWRWVVSGAVWLAIVLVISYWFGAEKYSKGAGVEGFKLEVGDGK